MAINREDFAQQCVESGVWVGVQPHFLMAVAQLRTGIVNRTGGEAIGPYRVTEAEWNADGSHPDLQIHLPADRRKMPFVQVLHAAIRTLRVSQAFSQEQGRHPTSVELYRAAWPDDPDIAVAGFDARLQAALDATRAEIVDAFAVLYPATAPGEADLAGDDPNIPPRTGAGAGPGIQPSEKLFAEKCLWIMVRLVDAFDLTGFQVAGILGNLGHECAGFRDMHEKGMSSATGGLGWAQWSKSRRTAFEAFAAEKGLTVYSDEANFGFLMHELRSTHAVAITELRKTTTLSAAVERFEATYEKAGVKNFPSRERWATLALDLYRAGGQPGAAISPLPVKATGLLQAAVPFRVLASAHAGKRQFWLVGEGGEVPGQVLIEQRSDGEVRVLKRDTLVVPLKGLGLPSEVVADLESDIESPEPVGKTPGIAVPASERAERLFAAAVAAVNMLVSRHVKGTNNGQLACAWAVNTLASQALGKPIGGNLATAAMAKVLVAKHQELPENALVAGAIVISPTAGGVTGHVGIVGTPAVPVGKTKIYSNGSSRGVFLQNYTVESWHARFDPRGLAIRYFLP